MRKNILLTLLFSFYSSNLHLQILHVFQATIKLGDSAYWSITAIELFAQKKYEDAVAVVDLCFDIWGPEAKKIQKEMHDDKVPAPAVGKVSPEQKKAIQKNFLDE